MEPVQKLFDSIAELQEKANVNAIFGEPVTVQGRTIIPVAKVAYGFGAGVGSAPMIGAEGKEDEKEAVEEMIEGASGGGGGGGVQARPFAIIEVTPESTWVEPLVDEQKVALAGSLLAGWSVFWLARTLVKIFGRRE